jgi:putative ABC transport system permease protein
LTLPISYNVRNLFVRKLSTSLTLVVIGSVVFVLVWMLAFVSGIRASMKASGWPQNIIALKPGATAESTSIIRQADAVRVVQTPGVARNAAGDLLISHELCVQTNINRRSDGRQANVAVRGVEPMVFEVHPELRIVEGRCFQPGELECIVGKTARAHFAGLDIGKTVTMGRSTNREYKIVGMFESRGSAMESEIFALRTAITNSYKREFMSSIAIRMADASLVPAAIEYLNGPAVELEARDEPKYFKDLSGRMLEIAQLTGVLVAIMAIGAAFAVANTMFAAVDSRRREIAMLRTIGFPRAAILSSFVLESLLIGVIGCALGLIGSAYFNGQRQDFLSDQTWTVLAFEMKVTAPIVAAALVVALGVAVLGAVAPALRASRVRVVDALRRA